MSQSYTPVTLTKNIYIAGKDFDAGGSTLRFKIYPDEQRLSVRFEVKDEDIPEIQERFEFFLSVPRGDNWSLGRNGNALILINDNDGRCNTLLFE